MTSTGQTWIRAREDDGEIVEDSVQIATLHANRVEFEDGTVSTECPWNAALPLDAYLYALDYEPLSVTPA